MADATKKSCESLCGPVCMFACVGALGPPLFIADLLAAAEAVDRTIAKNVVVKLQPPRLEARQSPNQLRNSPRHNQKMEDGPTGVWNEIAMKLTHAASVVMSAF